MDENLDTVRLAELINTEPVVFAGCSVNELIAIAVAALLAAAPLAGVPAFAVGGAPLAIGAAAIVALLAGCALAAALRRLKRDKPDHHYRLLLLVLGARLRLHRRVLLRDGRWSPGRSLPGGAIR